MIDAEEVGFIQAGLEVGDQFAGGGEIVPKRFFDYNAGGKCRADEAGFGKLLDDGGKVVRRRLYKLLLMDGYKMARRFFSAAHRDIF